MKELIAGHTYELNHLDGKNTQILQFVNRNFGQECEGTNNQEVLRALIERLKFLNFQMHCDLNKDIMYHLRMALVLHEARALIRKVEKGELIPEKLPVGKDGHFMIHK